MVRSELQQAIAILKSGDKQTGQRLLHQLLEAEPDNETAWLWLATAVDSCSEKIRCLARVLELNPDNETARQSIARLDAAPSLAASDSSPTSFKRLNKRSEEPALDPLSEATKGPVEAVSLTWDEVWFSVVGQPSIITFERILADPQTTPNRAYRWLFFSSLIAATLSFLLKLIVEKTSSGTVNPITLLLLLIGVSVGPLIAVLLTAFSTVITQWIARSQGGQGSYSQLIYARAAYSAPLSIVIAALTPIPYLSLLNIPLYIYTFILDLLALRAVNRFGWGSAVGAILIPGVIIGVIIGCGAVLLSFLFAAAIINR